MKKLISTILATAMIVSIATSLGAYAYANTYSDGDIIESGNVEYTVLSAKDKTCAISGYYGNELNFVVPSTFDNFTITEISLLAFYGSKIESISVPSTVKAIGGSAFENCANLESVTLPSGIKSIGANAFAGTAYLSNEENWNGSAFYIGDYLYNVKTDCTGRFEIKEAQRSLLIVHFHHMIRRMTFMNFVLKSQKFQCLILLNTLALALLKAAKT